VCRSDGSIWFTDPPFGVLGYYEGHVANPELPTNVYRVDRRRAGSRVVAGDINRPNGLAFSPTSRSCTSSRRAHLPGASTPTTSPAAHASRNKRRLIDAGPGTPDGLRAT